MPNLKAAKKHVRQAEWRTERNRGIKSELRTLKKKLLITIDKGSKEESEVLFKKVSSTYDVAAKKKIIHKKTADRNKSRLSKRVLKLAK